MTEPIKDDAGTALLIEFEIMRIKADIMTLVVREDIGYQTLREGLVEFLNNDLAPLPERKD